MLHFIRVTLKSRPWSNKVCFIGESCILLKPFFKFFAAWIVCEHLSPNSWLKVRVVHYKSQKSTSKILENIFMLTLAILILNILLLSRNFLRLVHHLYCLLWFILPDLIRSFHDLFFLEDNWLAHVCDLIGLIQGGERLFIVRYLRIKRESEISDWFE